MEITKVHGATSSSVSRPEASGREGNKLESIEYVRGLAAVAVIIWHTHWSRTVLGQSGVDAFFVVSGFVMMLVSRREATPVSFGVARLLRIVPFYWMVTLVAAAVNRPAAEEVWSSLLFWPSHPFPVVIQGWSLNMEMLYYGLFAAALLAPYRWRLPVLAAEFVLLCVVLPSVAMLPQPLVFWSRPIGFEFLAGSLLYAAWSRGAILTGIRAWGLAAVSAAALAATILLGDAPDGWARACMWGLPALGLVAGALGIERAGQLPRIGLLRQLGAASYAIYLTHYLLLEAMAGTLHRVWAPVAVAAGVVVCCLVGWVVHLWIERPLHLWGKRLVGGGVGAARFARRVRLAS